MAASDARPFPLKNTAYRVTFPIFDADGDLVTGAASLDTELSGDGGTFADATNEATEIATSSGMYYLDLTAGEMNYDTVAIIVKTTTSGAKTTPMVLYPVEATDIPVNIKAISDDTTSADNLESYTDGTTPAPVNVTQVSGDGTAADNLETMLDGTGGQALTLGQLRIDSSAAAGAVVITNSGGAGVAISNSDANSPAVSIDSEGYTTSLLINNSAGNTAVSLKGTTSLDLGGSTNALEASGGGAIADVFKEANVKGIADSTSAAEALQDALDADSVINLSANIIGSVGSVASGGITAASIATGAIDADALAADAGTEIGTAVWATAARTLTAATNITSTGGTTVPQTGDSYARLGAPAGASVSADVAAVKSDTAAILTDTGTTLDTLIKDIPTTAEFEARTLVAADYVIVSDLGTVQTGDAFARLGAPAGASVSADVAAVKSDTAAILADTGTTLDTLIKDIPTNAELTAALAGADDATLAAIAALNNLSSAQAQSAATAALNAYDPPTNAEMEARTLPAADYVVVGDTLAAVTTVGSVTGAVGSVASGGITAASIATGAIDADALAADAVTEIQAGLATGVLAATLEGAMTLAEALRVMLAALAGASSGGGTTAVAFLGQDGLTTRISATVDGSGNRTSVTLDGGV